MARDSRVKASGENVNGLVDADDAKADLLAFKIPEGELTKEVMVLHGGTCSRICTSPGLCQAQP